MKRIFLFTMLNFAIMLSMMVVLHVVCLLMGVDPNQLFSSKGGIDLGGLAVFSLVWGMAGGFISLLLSKTMAKMSVGAKTIDGTEGAAERWLVETVRELAERANLKMPEVAVYHGEANAFATGAFRNSALVAVSDSIIRQMTKDELRAVLGHEMSHVANGDMVTMTLLQGVLNACVIFLSRVVAMLAAGALNRDGERRRGGSSGLYHLVYFVMQFALGIGASIVAMWYSRHREYAADAGSAELLGSPGPMIAALRRLGNLQPGVLPDSIKAFGISGGMSSLFATHPALEDRIAALERLQQGI